MKICVICEKKFEPRNRNQITCGREECKKARWKEYIRIYDQKNKEVKKKKRREHTQKPEVKERFRAREKIYESQQEVRDRRKRARALPKNKLKKKLYWEGYSQRLEVKERKKRYTKERKEEKRIYDKAYTSKPDVKTRINKYMEQRKKNDVGYGILCSLRIGFNKKMDLYSTTGKIRASLQYGINHEKGVKYLGNKPQDGNEYHLDHIIPASWFDHNNPQEVKWCWAPENLQWLRKELNLWKSNKFILPLTIKEQDLLMKEMFPERNKNN